MRHQPLHVHRVPQGTNRASVEPMAERGNTARVASVPLRRRVEVIINSKSGAAANEAVAEQVREFLSARGIQSSVVLSRTVEELIAAVSRAAQGEADVVVAAGGDGTIATVAGELLGTSKVLGILPIGTFNYFAQHIGVPLDIPAALEVIVDGAPTMVDVGEVNGRVFLNNSSIGLYPEALRKREAAYRWFGRSQAAAYLSFAYVLLRPPDFLNLQLTIDDAVLPRRTPLVFVGVNPLQLSQFGIAGAECLDSSRLALYVTRPLSVPQLWRLAGRGVLRGLYGSSAFEVICARELVVTLRRRRVRVAMDGEVVRLHTPLRYRLLRGALRVLVRGSGVITQHGMTPDPTT